MKPTATIVDELIFDVNSAYFMEHGGYDFAKKFYADVYDFAVQKVGGEQYILSAVMHADERNQALSQEVGHDVYHYHLHVMYIPTVQKDIRWSKRCKDKSLVGTVKETITQVSHSKKWASTQVADAEGKTHKIKSYSLLQDEFHQFMHKKGYTDLQRGKKGSTREHLSDVEYKTQQETQRLAETAQKVQDKQSELEKASKTIQSIQSKTAKAVVIDKIQVKSSLFDKDKVTISKSDWESTKKLAKKEVIATRQEKELRAKNRELLQENDDLYEQNAEIRAEYANFRYNSEENSLQSRVDAEKSRRKIRELDKLVDFLFAFLDAMHLREQFEQFRARQNQQQQSRSWQER